MKILNDIVIIQTATHLHLFSLQIRLCDSIKILMPMNHIKGKKTVFKSSNLLQFPAGQSKLIVKSSVKLSFSNESL